MCMHTVFLTRCQLLLPYSITCPHRKSHFKTAPENGSRLASECVSITVGLQIGACWDTPCVFLKKENVSCLWLSFTTGLHSVYYISESVPVVCPDSACPLTSTLANHDWNNATALCFKYTCRKKQQKHMHKYKHMLSISLSLSFLPSIFLSVVLPPLRHPSLLCLGITRDLM